MVNGDNLQMQTSCSPRIKKSSTTPSLQTQLILSTVKYMVSCIRMRHVYGEDDVLYTSVSCVTHVTSHVLHAMMPRVLRVYGARYFHQQ